VKPTEYAIQHRTTRRWVASDLRTGRFADTPVEAEAYRYRFASVAVLALEMCAEFAGAYEVVPVRAGVTP
jgi:hypothetical protein